MSGDDQTRYTLWAALEREAALKARVAELERYLVGLTDELTGARLAHEHAVEQLRALRQAAELEKAKGNGHTWTCDCDVCAVRQMRWEGFPLAKEEPQPASTVGNPPTKEKEA